MTEKKLLHYKNSSMADLAKIIDNRIDFSVLHRILQYNCADIFTNGKSLIICYSTAPYPIWVWCRDAENTEDMESLAECLKEHFPLEDGYNVIMSHAVLKRLGDMDSYFEDVSLKMELFSYRLKKINDINYPVDGFAKLATADEMDEIAILFKDMHYEMEGLTFTIEECRERVNDRISKSELYTWKNKDGKTVALTAKRIADEYGTVNAVYTLPEERRKGYAINLVHKVSQDIIAEGAIPILYTDGGYAASNECYKKIGFERVGSICNIKKFKVV